MKELGSKIGKFALAHVEKIVLAMACLVVLGLLAPGPFSDKWAAYDKSPLDFQTKIKEGRDAMVRHPNWPDDERTKFASRTAGELLTEQGQSLDEARYEYSTSFHFLPFEKLKADRMPVLLPVMELIADYRKVILLLKPGGADGSTGDGDPSSNSGGVIALSDLVATPGRYVDKLVKVRDVWFHGDLRPELEIGQFHTVTISGPDGTEVAGALRVDGMAFVVANDWAQGLGRHFPPGQKLKVNLYGRVVEIPGGLGRYFVTRLYKIETLTRDGDVDQSQEDPAAAVITAESGPVAGVPAQQSDGGGNSFAGGAGFDPSQAQVGAGGGPMSDEMEGNAEGAGGDPDGVARGFHCVAVRGWMRLGDQVENFKKALNLNKIDEARKLVDILDFVIERQQAVAGPNPWVGDWKEVDVDAAIAIVNRAAGWEIDYVSADLTDATMTSPLPKLATNKQLYYLLGTHPRLGVLARKDREQQAIENEQAISQQNQQQVQQSNSSERRGFSGVQHDVRGARRTAMQGQSGQQIRNEAQQQMQGDNYTPFTQGSGGERASGTSRRRQSALVGKVLLFRFFDFQVEPANAYRYRVQLVLRNPNHNKLPDQVDESVGKKVDDKTIRTPPSAPSGLWHAGRQQVVPGYAMVPPTVRYFVDRVRPGRGSSPSSVDFNIFQWYSQAGTTINDTLKAVLGQLIGGKSDSLVLRPSEESFENEDVLFATGDVLLDVFDALPLEPSEHPDLPLDELKQRRPALRSGGGALTVNRYGQLVAYDQGYGERSALGRTMYALQLERAPYQGLQARKKKTNGDGQGDSFPAAGGTGGGQQGQKKGKGQRGGKRNPIRRGGGGYGGSPMGGGGGGFGSPMGGAGGTGGVNPGGAGGPGAGGPGAGGTGGVNPGGAGFGGGNRGGGGRPR